MAKFNLNQLLSSTSLESSDSGAENKKHNINITMISVYDLIPSEDNFYSTDEIEDLKNSIEMFGVKQNLTVKKVEGGKYKVIAGHRRRLATIKLCEEGKKEFEYVPCGIETEEDSTKEKLLLIMTNSTTRQLSDWEKIQQTEEIKKLINELKGRGEKLPGSMRELIAETLNTSPSQIARMECIKNNLTNEFKEELKNENVKLNTAYEISGLSEEGQKEIFEEYKEKGSISINDVKSKKEKIKDKKINSNIQESTIDKAIKFIDNIEKDNVNDNIVKTIIEALEFYRGYIK